MLVWSRKKQAPHVALWVRLSPWINDVASRERKAAICVARRVCEECSKSDAIVLGFACPGWQRATAHVQQGKREGGFETYIPGTHWAWGTRRHDH